MKKTFCFGILTLMVALISLNIAAEPVRAALGPEVEPAALSFILAPGRLDTQELLVSNPTDNELSVEVKVEEWMDIHPTHFKIKAGEVKKCLLFVWLTRAEEELVAKQGWVVFEAKNSGKTQQTMVKVAVFGPRREPVLDPKDVRIGELEKEMAAKEEKIQALQQQLADLQEAKGTLATKLADEIKLLKGDVEKNLREYLACAEEKRRLDELVGKLKQEITALKEENSQQKERIVALEEEIAGWEKEFSAIKRDTNRLSTLYEALKEGLREEIAQGELSISLENMISLVLYDLFPSGCIYPKNEKGELLTKIGLILKKGLEPDFRIEARGHTDDVGIGAKLIQVYPTNWELSAARAATILHILRCRRGVEIDDKYLSLAGYGASSPIGDNDTMEGRRQNRRAEIIVFVP